MGGDYYDRDVGSSSSANVAYSSSSNEVIGKVNKLHSSMNPQRWKDDKLISEYKNPIVFALDVTGSMGSWTKIIYDKMPMFYGQIMMQNYLTDPAISFCAIGDYTCDEAPLQVTEFGQGKGIDQLISKMYLEGGGGGSYFESYELAAYFYIKHVELKNSELPYFFVTGDESFYEKIPEKQITKIIGKPIVENYINARECWKELMKIFNVFLIKKPYEEDKKETLIKQKWAETLGEERILVINTPKACVDVMLGAIAITSGVRTLDGYIKDMKDRGQDSDRIKEVSDALKKYNDKCINHRVKDKNVNVNIDVNILHKNKSKEIEDVREVYEKILMNDLDEEKLKLRQSLKEMKKLFGNQIPEELLCPITGEIFVDPVMTSDGHTYERRAIESWLEKHRTSPATNLNLDNKNLIPNMIIKQLVRNYYEENKNLIK
jgi:hypothetical protein